MGLAFSLAMGAFQGLCAGLMFVVPVVFFAFMLGLPDHLWSLVVGPFLLVWMVINAKGAWEEEHNAHT